MFGKRGGRNVPLFVMKKRVVIKARRPFGRAFDEKQPQVKQHFEKAVDRYLHQVFRGR